MKKKKPIGNSITVTKNQLQKEFDIFFCPQLLVLLHEPAIIFNLNN